MMVFRARRRRARWTARSMAGLAGCQTRPIAKAHHKTHDDDVRTFGVSRGRNPTGPGSTASALLCLELSLQFHFNHVQHSAGIISGRSHTSAVAPAASRSPSPHADELQPPAINSRNDDAEPQSSFSCRCRLPCRLPLDGDDHMGVMTRAV